MVKTDLALQQWMDLGNLSQACITVPESCGTNGGTVAAWIRVLECEDDGGIVTSFTGTFSSFSSLSLILCTSCDNIGKAIYYKTWSFIHIAKILLTWIVK